MGFVTGRSAKTAHRSAARRSRLLAMSALAAIASPLFLAASPAMAETQAPSYDFDMPAQSLSRSINQVASRANIQVLYSGDDTRDVTAPALKGKMTVDEALARLLAGSGFTYRYTQPGVITLLRASAGGNGDGEKVTAAVQIEGAQGSGSPYFGGAGVAAGVNGINGSRDITATEGTGSFTSGALTIGSKVPQALKDVPQSVSVLTNERMEQQNVTDFTTAMKQLPGVSLVQGETSLQTAFYSRGFEISSIQIDGGAPLTTLYTFMPQIDMSVYDHVELLRGAAGTFNGYGAPGGTVNLVRKKPLDHAQFSVEAQLGSWENYRLVADASSPLALDGKLRGRLVMTWQDNDFFYQGANDNKTLIYGIAELDVTPTTLLSGGINFTRQRSTPWFGGLPRYLAGGDLELPRSTSFVLPWNRWNFDTTELFGSIEQKIGGEWTAKFNLTHVDQSSTRKLGYSTGAVNDLASPNDLTAGPRLTGTYNDYASKQLSVEGSLTGALDIFGQRQEITLGASRVDSISGGMTSYASLISGSSSAPYQPYPGGPIYCNSSPANCPAGSLRLISPPIDVFNFDPNDPRYTEPRNPLPNFRYNEYGYSQTLAYANLRLTAFDRLHLVTGLRWSKYEYKIASEQLCVTIPASGTPSETNCVGRQIGDAYNPTGQEYSDTDISWPPAVTLTFDVTRQLNAYLGYTDIYQSQASNLDGDLNPIDPVTGSNWEAGLKWAPRDGKLNLSIAGFSIRQKGFPTLDGVYDYNVTAEDIANGIYSYLVASNGRRVPNGQTDPDHYCCYTSNPDRTFSSDGVDVEATGEIATGWQIAAGYTYNRTRQVGSSFGDDAGQTFISIQPEHNYKLWMSYDFGAAGSRGFLAGLTLSGGINGQSSSFHSGTTCKSAYILVNSTTNTISCPDQDLDHDGVKEPGSTPFSFTVPAYAVLSGRIDYRLSDKWSLAINLDNILDKTYYQASGQFTSGGNWYGAPRSFTAMLRAKW